MKKLATNFFISIEFYRNRIAEICAMFNIGKYLIKLYNLIYSDLCVHSDMSREAKKNRVYSCHVELFPRAKSDQRRLKIIKIMIGTEERLEMTSHRELGREIYHRKRK